MSGDHCHINSEEHMIKTVLLPTDFSMNSIHSILYGLELFKGKDVKYILMNAYTDPSVGANMTYVWEDQMRKISETMLKSLEEKIREDYGHSEFKAIFESQYGDIPHAMTPVVQKYNVDLVIMGSSGAGSPNISIFGTNAYAAMKSAQCPILTVPLQSKIKAPSRIGLASEVKLFGNEPVLKPLQELAEVHSSWVMGIHVHEEKVTAGLEDESIDMRENGGMDYIDLAMDDTLSGIEMAIGEHNIDLLTIIIKKRTFLDRIFHKSVSKQIAREAAIPILTLHE